MHTLRNSRNFNGARRQKGATLVELAIWLAIAAAILFGVFYVLRVVQSKRITTAEAQNMTVMASDLRTKFSSQGTFAGLTNATAIAINAVPKTMINGGNVMSGFSTAVTIASANVNGVADDGFSLTLGVPADSCSDFISGVEGAFSRVAIGATTVKDLAAGDTVISPADMAACAATQVGNANTNIVLAQGR